jgi:hypothetical protein
MDLLILLSYGIDDLTTPAISTNEFAQIIYRFRQENIGFLYKTLMTLGTIQFR